VNDEAERIERYVCLPRPCYIRYSEAADAVGRALIAAGDDATKMAMLGQLDAEMSGDDEPDPEVVTQYEALVLRPANCLLQLAAQAGRLRAWGNKVKMVIVRGEIPPIAWVDNFLDLAEWPGQQQTSALGRLGEGWLYVNLVFARDDVERVLSGIIGGRARGGMESVQRTLDTIHESRQTLDEWYRERVRTWPPDKPPPSSGEDWDAAKKELDPNLAREALRAARRDYAPPGWTKAGPRPSKAQKR
jgi:hypothetical protein